MLNTITTTEALAAACQTLAKAGVVMVDTEFLRETTYYPRLCVIQLATDDLAVAVDALAPGLDLAPFLDLMRDEAVLKVFHAGRQDIEIIFHLGNFVPRNVFDTQVAAMVCGFGDSISYDQLVQRITGHQIDKSSRFTDWSRRPLTDKQLAYALGDVTHLRDVYAFLAKKLAEEGRTDWVREEMHVLTARETYDQRPEDAWERIKLRVRRPIELAVVQELAAWREREARSRDVPRSRVMKDEGILELAGEQPLEATAMVNLRSFSKGFERSRTGEDVLAIIRRVHALPKDKLPQIPRGKPAPEGSGAAVDLLRVLLKLIAEQNGVAAKVLATTDDLEAIAADDNADVPAMRGWRRELFGEAALKLKRGELALSFDGRKIIMRDCEAPVVTRRKAKA